VPIGKWYTRKKKKKEKKRKKEEGGERMNTDYLLFVGL
jgi:hypothetical protein